MYTATLEDGSQDRGEIRVDNERVLGVYGIILGILPGALVLIFWAMGALHLLTGNGGLINELQLTGAWRFLFLSYPVVLVLAFLAALGAFAIKRYKEAAGIAMLPVIGVVVYYLALVQLR